MPFLLRREKEKEPSGGESDKRKAPHQERPATRCRYDKPNILNPFTLPPSIARCANNS
jgi:hypothetical protein